MGRQRSRVQTRRRDNNNTTSENIIDIKDYKKPLQKNVVLLPKNRAQEKYIDALKNPDISVVVATGPAGTGKTMLATLSAVKMLKENSIDKIIITRPAVSVDEQHGFLPGTLIDKMQPWVLPILDYFYEYYSKKQVLTMIENNLIEIAPLAYMRGRTFRNSFIIADECQNTTVSQMKMLLTRIGPGSRIVVTGDMEQHDRGYEENGLKDFLDRVQPTAGIATCNFAKKDVERHPMIETILNFYQ